MLEGNKFCEKIKQEIKIKIPVVEDEGAILNCLNCA